MWGIGGDFPKRCLDAAPDFLKFGGGVVWRIEWDFPKRCLNAAPELLKLEGGCVDNFQESLQMQHFET